MIDWDAYRAAYPRMTYAEVAAFHRRVWECFPDQEHHSPEFVARFVTRLPAGATVLEVGGWRGSAAGRSLAQRPDLGRWDNFEICEAAASSPVTDDARYRGIFPDRWPWEVTLTGRYDAAVLAHVIEHMSDGQFACLPPWLAAAGVRSIYVEAPLRDTPRSWRHASSAHVLGLGWAEVIRLFGRSGFRVNERHRYGVDRVVLFLERAAA